MEGRRCQWVTAVSTASPLTRDARTCPLGKHLAGSSVAIVRNSGKKQQILKLRPTLKKKFLPTFYLFFFFSSFYSPDPPHPNPPFTSSSAIPGAQGLKEGQNQVPGSCCVLPSAPGTQEGLVAERPLPGRSLRCAPASPSSGASPAAPQTRLEIVWWPQPG